MEDLFKSIVLGIVEGITEFLPVSSTGHLVIVNQWIRFDQKDFNTLFDIVIQLGAILAVVVVFWKRLFPITKDSTPQLRQESLHIWGKAIVGLIPAGIAAIFFANWIEDNLFNAFVVSGTLIFYGLVFIAIELFPRKTKYETVGNISYLFAFFIGLFQVLAMVPGTSRSGITIIGALLLGVGRVAATEFTFFLAIPTMGSATLYSLYKYLGHHQWSFTSGQTLSLLAGLLVAFLVAWAVIMAFLKFVQKNNFISFGIYRILLGVAVLSYFFITAAPLYK